MNFILHKPNFANREGKSFEKYFEKISVFSKDGLIFIMYLLLSNFGLPLHLQINQLLFGKLSVTTSS